MKIKYIRAMPGPNVYLDRPVLTARVELETLTERETNEFPSFVERLLRCLPGLREHHCAKGAPGGFVERLYGGTYFGHTVEHVALELTNLAGVGANFGRTVYVDAPGRYDVIMEYRNEPVARFLLPIALDLVEALLDDRPYALEARLAEARRLAADTELGPSTRAIVEAAGRRGIPWLRLSEGSLVQLGHGRHRKFIQATESSLTPNISVDIACDKELTKQLLDAALLPVPRGVVARSPREAVAALEELHPPLVVKPLDGNQGRGVSLRLNTPTEVAGAYELAATVSPIVIVEEYFTGRDYRVVVVNGKVIAASERRPACVVGDGILTLGELIERENLNPLRGDGHEKPLTKLIVDEAVLALLERSGRDLKDIPAAGEPVFLRAAANLSTGGTARDVTDQVHPEVARMCERAARVIGLDICGIDLILPNIGAPPPDSGGGIIEVNASPGIRMHHHPSAGRPRDVGQAVIDMLYPPGTTGRIPTCAITGTNGKTTVTRMIAHALQSTGNVVGMTTTEGIWIGGACVARGDFTGFQSARTVLGDPLVEVAVLETARGGIVRRGLGYDWTDVGVLTNIQPDHLGQDGIETVDDLLHIKSLVAERVRAGGTLVLNAEDERLVALPEQPRVRRLQRCIVFFALCPNNAVVRAHRQAGGTAFFVRDDWLVEAEGRNEYRVIHSASIPVTLGGAARFQTANALAALAASRALGLSREEIATALAGFQSDQDNGGRMNLYRVARGYVIVDYAHNPGAFAALSDLAASWPDRRLTAIFTVPGDRGDGLVEQVGRVAARGFDRLFIREDEDPRGRERGEIAARLAGVVKQEAPEKECRIILNESDALLTALQEMEDDEIVILLFEKYTEPCFEILQRFGARPVTAIEPRSVPQAAQLVCAG